ncbi:MAG: SRPBCC family protein [Pseudomonadota bacterium]
MPRVVKSVVLDASVDAVWDVLRDFNGHDRWHPAVATSHVERGRASDEIGCIRRFTLADGGVLREQLLTLSDVEQTYSYCLLDTPIPLFNYVSHVRLLPVTDGDRTFWQWESRFDTRHGEDDAMSALVGTQIYAAGFGAIAAHLGVAHSGEGAGAGAGANGGAA